MRLHLLCLGWVLFCFSGNSLAQRANVFFTLEFRKYNVNTDLIDTSLVKAEDRLSYKKRIDVGRGADSPHDVLREMAEKSGYSYWLPMLQNLVDAIPKVDLKTAPADYYKRGHRQVEVRMTIPVYTPNWFDNVYLDIRDTATDEYLGIPVLTSRFLSGGRLPEVSDLAARQIGILVREDARPGSTDPAQIEKEEREAAAAVQARRDEQIKQDLYKARRLLSKYRELDTFTPKHIELLEEIIKAADDMKVRKR